MPEVSPPFYLSQLRQKISQGDIFFQIFVADLEYPATIPTMRYINAVMLTHDCEFDKPKAMTALFAEIRPMHDVPIDSQGHVRNNTPLHTFYLPASDGLEESYVNLRRIYQVDKKFLTQQGTTRFRSVEEDVRLALERVISTYFGVERDLAGGLQEDTTGTSAAQSTETPS